MAKPTKPMTVADHDEMASRIRAFKEALTAQVCTPGRFTLKRGDQLVRLMNKLDEIKAILDDDLAEHHLKTASNHLPDGRRFTDVYYGGDEAVKHHG